MSENKKAILELLSQFTGFSTKSELKQLASQSIQLINSPSFTTPHKQNDSPIVKTFNLILYANVSNQRLVDQMLSTICDAVHGGFFGAKHASECINLIEKYYSHASQNTQIKIIQFSATVLPLLCLDQAIVSGLFSITFNMINSPISVVATTAFATTSQMFSILFNLYSNFNENEIPKVVLNRIKSLTNLPFKRDLNRILYMLIKDIFNMAFGKKAEWIRIGSLPIEKSVSLMNIIMSSHSEFIKKEQSFIDVIDSIVQTAEMKESIHFAFYITFTSLYADVFPARASFLFKSCLKKLTGKSTQLPSLVFFRAVFALSPDFLSNFIENCDKECVLINSLLSKLQDLVKETDLQSVVSLSVNIMKDVSNVQTNFIATSPLEIALCVVLGSNEKIIQMIWENLLSLMIYAIRFSALDSLDIVFQCYCKLAKLLHAAKLEEPRLICVRVIENVATKQRAIRENPLPVETLACNLLHTSKKGMLIKQKRIVCYNLLVSLFTEDPMIFDGAYGRLFLAFSMFQKRDISVERTKDVSIISLMRIIAALVKDDEFYINYLSKIYIVNIDKLKELWKPEILNLMFENENIIKPVIALLVDVFDNVKPQDNFIFMIKFYKTVLTSGVLTAKYQEERSALLDELTKKITENDGFINHEVLDILYQSFSVQHCISSESVLSAFKGYVSLINKSAEVDDPQAVISSLFGFIDQKINDDVAIKAIDFINEDAVLSKIIKEYQKDELWISLLSHFFVYFTDPREQVALECIEACFDILESNSKEITPKIYDHILTSCLTPFFDSLNQQGSHNAINKAIISTAKLMIHSYDNFVDEEGKKEIFLNQFLPNAINSVENYQIESKKFDVHQFFIELLGFAKLPANIHSSLAKSFVSIITKLADENINDYSTVFINAYKTEKINNKLNEENIDMWISCASKLLISLENSDIADNNAPAEISKKLLKIITNPLQENTENITWKTCLSLREIAVNIKSELLQKEAISRLNSELENQTKEAKIVQFCQIVAPVFLLPCSAPLLETLLNKDIIMETKLSPSCADSLFTVLMQMESSEFKEATDEYKEAQKNVLSKLVDLFPLVSNGSRLTFIRAGLSFDVIELLWDTFCNPDEKTFSDKVCESCFEELFNQFTAILKQEMSVSESTLLARMLEFLSAHKVVPRRIGNSTKCNTWHLIRLIPQFIALLEDSRPEVPSLAQKLLLSVNKDFGAIIGE